MALGAVQSGYAGTSYTYRRTTGVTEEFHGDISSASQMTGDGSENNGKVIGLTMIPYGNTKESYGMKAQYAAESTPDNPVIQVTSNYGGKQEVYKVNVNDVDPRNASQLEMFALLSYSDDQGISDGGTFGSYHRMKTYADNAQMNGYWEGNGNWDSFANAKHDWIAIMNRMTDDYSGAGVYSQYFSGQKLVETLSRFSTSFMENPEKLQENTGKADESAGAPDNTGAEKPVDYMQFIRERIEEILEKVQNGDTEESFPIGGSSFTIKEWEKFLENFDDIEDAIRELMREEQAKRAEEEKKAEALIGTSEEIDALVSESTRCTYPSSVPGQEDTLYITWYTEEGIFCRKAGQSGGYEWSLHYKNKEDYGKVLELLDRFDEEDNLRFAARKNFWLDFLNNKINIDEIPWSEYIPSTEK